MSQERRRIEQGMKAYGRLRNGERLTFDALRDAIAALQSSDTIDPLITRAHDELLAEYHRRERLGENLQ